MTCEEFERVGWDAERDTSLSAEERAAAFEHATHCPACAALEDSWRAAKLELRAFGAATEAIETPSRVEMRLRQEFRTRHRSLRVRRTAMTASWVLAAAAVIFGAVTWVNWRNGQRKAPMANLSHAGSTLASAPSDGATTPAETLVADSNGGDFTPLPGSMVFDSDDASIVRVRMQRGSLSALGLPVNEDRASDWIQVDLLVTEDGLPQAVRLSR
jgi:hypothetical protein